MKKGKSSVVPTKASLRNPTNQSSSKEGANYSAAQNTNRAEGNGVTPVKGQKKK